MASQSEALACYSRRKGMYLFYKGINVPFTTKKATFASLQCWFTRTILGRWFALTSLAYMCVCVCVEFPWISWNIPCGRGRYYRSWRFVCWCASKTDCWWPIRTRGVYSIEWIFLSFDQMDLQMIYIYIVFSFFLRMKLDWEKCWDLQTLVEPSRQLKREPFQLFLQTVKLLVFLKTKRNVKLILNSQNCVVRLLLVNCDFVCV